MLALELFLRGGRHLERVWWELREVRIRVGFLFGILRRGPFSFRAIGRARTHRGCALGASSLRQDCPSISAWHDCLCWDLWILDSFGLFITPTPVPTVFLDGLLVLAKEDPRVRRLATAEEVPRVQRVAV